MGNMRNRPPVGRRAGSKYIWSSPAVIDEGENAKTKGTVMAQHLNIVILQSITIIIMVSGAGRL
jgi:hypothetical protein